MEDIFDDPGLFEFMEEENKFEDTDLENDFYEDSPNDYNISEEEL